MDYTETIEKILKTIMRIFIVILFVTVCLYLVKITAPPSDDNISAEIKAPKFTQEWSVIPREVDYTYLTATKPVETVEKPTETEWVSLGEYTITAYCPCVKCCGIWSKQYKTRINDPNYIQKTASGTIPTAGRTVGADTSVLPFGTVIMIDGHEYTVEDTGGAAKGKKLIDVYCDTHAEAVEFGKKKMEVFIKKEG